EVSRELGAPPGGRHTGALLPRPCASLFVSRLLVLLAPRLTRRRLRVLFASLGRTSACVVAPRPPSSYSHSRPAHRARPTRDGREGSRSASRRPTRSTGAARTARFRSRSGTRPGARGATPSR